MEKLTMKKLTDHQYLEKIMEKLIMEKKKRKIMERLVNNNCDKYNTYQQSLLEKYPDYYLYQAEKNTKCCSVPVNATNNGNCVELNINDNCVNIEPNTMVKKIYKLLVLRLHPDKNINSNILVMDSVSDNNTDVKSVSDNNTDTNSISDSNTDVKSVSDNNTDVKLVSDNNTDVNINERTETQKSTVDFIKLKNHFDKNSLLGLLKICYNNHIELDKINIDDAIICVELELSRLKKLNQRFRMRVDYVFLIGDHETLKNYEESIVMLLKDYVKNDIWSRQNKLRIDELENRNTINNLCAEEQNNNKILRDLDKKISKVLNDYNNNNDDKIGELKNKKLILEESNTKIKMEINELKQKNVWITNSLEKLSNAKTRAEIADIMTEQKFDG
jgi:hypothetical protein